MPTMSEKLALISWATIPMTSGSTYVLVCLVD